MCGDRLRIMIYSEARPRYLPPACVVYEVTACHFVCQSRVEVTFSTDVDREWDGKVTEVELARSSVSSCDVWEEW